MGSERFGVSMDSDLLAAFDGMLQDKGYTNRSAALRDMVRQALLDAAWGDDEAQVHGAVALVYDHHRRELVNALLELQHDALADVVCSTHVHLAHSACLEIILCRGRAGDVRALAEQLVRLDGVLHGNLMAVAADSLDRG